MDRRTPDRDFLGLRPMIPAWALPASFAAKPRQIAMNPNPAMPPNNPTDSGAPPENPANPNAHPGGVPSHAPVIANKPVSDDDTDPLAKPADDLSDDKPADDMTAEDKADGDKPDAMADDTAAEDDPLAVTKPKAKPIKPTVKPKKPADDLEDDLGDKMTSDDDKPAADDKMTDDKMTDDKMTDDTAADDPLADKSSSSDDLIPAEPPVKKPGKKTEPVVTDDLEEDPLADTKPATTKDDLTDDLMPPDDEPAKPAVAAKPLPPVAPANAPTYSIEELEKAVGDVTDSEATMSAADTLTPEDLKKARSQYYLRYYRLGEVLTFATNDPAAEDLPQQQSIVKELLSNTASDPEKLAQIGRAAAKWLTFAKRKEHSGILLAGTVGTITQQGKLYEMKIIVPDAEPISVYSGSKPKLTANDHVILLGSIVDKPAEALPGYKGADCAGGLERHGNQGRGWRVNDPRRSHGARFRRARAAMN